MCFIIHKDYPSVQIAERDITCFKVLTHFKENGDTESPFRFETYFKKGGSSKYIIKKVKEFTYRFNSGFNDKIYKGLHSYSDLETAKLNADWYEEIHESIIPKGTPYYYNPDDQEYVSLKLKVFRKPMLHS